MGSGIWELMLHIVYPPRCPACRSPVEEQGAWCPVCLSAILSLREINLREHRLKYLDSCRVICEYTGGLKRVMHDMKFRRQKKYGTHLRWLLSSGRLPLAALQIDGVIPVPLNEERLKERGYNQTEVIFGKWAKAKDLDWLPGNLMRRKPTIPQWQLSLAKRRENIKGAFLVTRPAGVERKHILLVDDIITTGITLDECAKVLKQAGAASVHGLAVASGSR